MMYLGLVAAIVCCGAMMVAESYAIPLWGWLGLGGIAGLVAWQGRSRRRWWIPALLLVVAAVGGLRMEWASRQYEALPHYMAKGDVIVTGTVVSEKSSFMTEKGEMVRYVVAGESIAFAAGGKEEKMDGKLYLTIPATPRYEPTETIQFRGIVKDISYYRNGGMYDAYHRDKEQRIFLKAYSQDAASTVSVKPPGGWRYILYCWREGMTERFKTVLGPDDAHILSSLLFGGHYEDLPPALLDSFSATGLIHILSVSGAHMALLLSIVQLVGKALGLRQRPLFALSVAFVLIYGGLAEFTAPVVRSAMMGLIAAYSLQAQREYVSCQALAIAIFAMVLYSPYLVYDISFRLSCGASAGIILLQPAIGGFLRGWPLFLRNTAAVCVSAQLLVLPIICANFFALPVYTLLANLTVGPVLDIVIVLGLGAAVTGAIIPVVGQGVLQVIEPLLTLAVTGNQFIASLPYSRYWVGAMPLGYSVAWYALVCAVFGPTAYRKVIGAVAVSLAIVTAVWQGIQRPDATVLVFDLGNDQATCVTFPDKTSHLWYNKSEWSNPEQAAVVLTPALRYEGIFSLTQCVVTGHEPTETGRQLAANFTITGGIMYPKAMDRPERVVSGAIPYDLYASSDGLRETKGRCVEIREALALTDESFPREAAALIIQGKTGRATEVYTNWLEAGELYDIPTFSPRRDGQIKGVYRQNTWTFSTYGGERA